MVIFFSRQKDMKGTNALAYYKECNLNIKNMALALVKCFSNKTIKFGFAKVLQHQSYNILYTKFHKGQSYNFFVTIYSFETKSLECLSLPP